MRRTSWLAAAMATALSAAAEPPPGSLGAGGDTVEVSVIGWSPDETSLAFRILARQEPEPTDDVEPIECEGYVDHRGKKFRGALALVVIESGGAPHVHPIQGGNAHGEPCTPLATAKERLATVKEVMARLQIDPAKSELAGTTTTKSTIKLAGGVSLKAVSTVTRGEQEEGTAPYTGTVSLAAGSAKLHSVSIDEQYTLAMGGNFEAGVKVVLVSPSSARAVALYKRRFSSGRGTSENLFLLGKVEVHEKKARAW